MKKLVCIAHRGASGHEPENTLSAVEKAIELGADWIEVDVYAVEGELMVIHDERLERTTNGAGYVKQTPLAELRSLDAGKGQCIPTLREVLDSVDGRTGINVELKGTKSAGLAVSLIEEYVRERQWNYEQFIVSSFNRRQLRKVRKLNPRIRIGILIDRPRRRYAIFARRYDAYSSSQEIGRLQVLGVDGIFTDFPELVVER